jgi:3-hydroxyisobutyrate dehydrogenase
MAGHLLEAGYPLRVFNRTPARADELVDRGAQRCASPAELAADSDVVFTMLGTPADVRGVVLEDGDVLQSMREGALLIDTTTSEPSLAQELHEAGAARGVQVLDAPVSGGDVGARNATLVIMVGGDADAFERGRPLLEVLGRLVRHQGGPGSGQHTKMTNQIAIAAGMIAVCEALLYAYRAGLDLEATVATIEGGAAGSWSLSNYGPRLLKGDLEPGFKVEHFIKDLGIALAQARRMGLSLPGTALAEQLYIGVQSQGMGQKGTQSLLVALAQLSHIEWRDR